MYDADFIGADEFEEDSLLLSYSACFGMYFHVSPDPVSPFAQWMVRLKSTQLCGDDWADRVVDNIWSVAVQRCRQGVSVSFAQTTDPAAVFEISA